MARATGAYKFTRKPDGDILSMKTIAAIHEKLPSVHLVMHGSSSVPQELQDLINAYGGEMPQTYGVPVEEIEKGIKMGVRKVNIDTDCRNGDDRAVPQGGDGNADAVRPAQVSHRCDE